MPQSGNDPNKSQMTVRTPYVVKKAYSKLAHDRNAQDPFIDVTQSDLQREAVYEYLLNHWDELPADVQQELPHEALKNEVEEGPGAAITQAAEEGA